MKNPFSEASKLQRQLNKEAKTELPDFDALQVIQDEPDFAEFLIGIDPKYADMDLENKKNVKTIREKYLLFTQQKEVAADLGEVYGQEIIAELGIDIPKGEQKAAFSEMGKELEKIAQKDSVEFQRLKGKLEEYKKVKEELLALEEKFEEKVKMSGREGVQAMKDRQTKMEQATGKIFFSKAGSKANLGRMFGNRDMAHAVADFKTTYELEGAELASEMAESGSDLKAAEKLREKLDTLREYLLKDLDLAKGVIEAAQRAARDVIRAQVTELRGPDRFDSMDPQDRDNERQSLIGIRSSGTNLTLKQQNDLDRLNELDELDNMESGVSSSDPVRLAELRGNLIQRGRARIQNLEATRTLAVKMTEGKGKKGGVDFTRAIILSDGTIEEIHVIDLDTGADDVDVDNSFKKTLEKAIEGEVKFAIENAAQRSSRLTEFMAVASPLFEKWRVGGKDSRDTVKTFMAKTLQNVCKDQRVNPVLKVQIKAFLAQRGLNPIKFVIP